MIFFYFVKEALRGFYQAKLMTFVAVVTIGLTLFFLGCVMVGYLNIKQWLQSAAERVEAVAYIDEPVAADSLALAECVSDIRSTQGVVKTVVVDKKEAWARFKSLYGTAMLEAVEDNPFPVSVELTLDKNTQTTDRVQTLKKELLSVRGIEEVQVSQAWVAMVQKFRNYFLAATICIGLVLIVTLHFMIANTIKLTIYGRKELLRNMHYVGATSAYIKMPFILEGILQGLVGGALAVIALFIVKISLSHVPVFWGHWSLFFFLFPIGAMFGCIGSMSAVRKFLVA